MFSLIIFIISLVSILFIFLVKALEIKSNKVFPLTKFLSRFDNSLLSFLKKTILFLKYINFRNLYLLFSWILFNINKQIKNIKKRFDHKHSHFFSKKGSVSFFLKDVSDYKKSLRENKK